MNIIVQAYRVTVKCPSSTDVRRELLVLSRQQSRMYVLRNSWMLYVYTINNTPSEKNQL